MTEAEFIAALRRLPLHPGALGLADDAARLGGFVVTTDTLVEGVHFLPDDPPGDVAWKLVAVSLSDLAGKGAEPEGVLLNYPLSGDAWDRAFVAGLDACLAALDCRLLGGDTVSLPAGAPRVLTVTAFGADAVAPPRSGAKAGDALWVTGTIGDAGAGLAIAQGADGPDALRAAYRRPRPRIAEGRILAPRAHAMMDVSDGLLIDAWRMAAASGLEVTIALDAVPLSAAYRAFAGDDPLPAATAGDDYQLLCALAPDQHASGHAARIGSFAPGHGLVLTRNGNPVALPEKLGFEHRA
ncbi:thiamine-phosphate kinase [Sphingomonas radiodurans]|uniref:thiamine-phosphate kinase n=1 Tax=Sphingomonas radiodurans TaxID=2890321 RepID=UPI001E2CA540|nr:thiamine-phosphate kinase [Sphingomonas radiodurans]WBH15217.1 thiamine-phosphate kinase [Sphingomonas radiodurans]